MKLEGDRKWCAWLTLVQSATLDDSFTPVERVRIIGAALQMPDDDLQCDPIALTEQAVSFVTEHRRGTTNG